MPPPLPISLHREKGQRQRSFAIYTTVTAGYAPPSPLSSPSLTCFCENKGGRRRRGNGRKRGGGRKKSDDGRATKEERPPRRGRRRKERAKGGLRQRRTDGRRRRKEEGGGAIARSTLAPDTYGGTNERTNAPPSTPCLPPLSSVTVPPLLSSPLPFLQCFFPLFPSPSFRVPPLPSLSNLLPFHSDGGEEEEGEEEVLFSSDFPGREKRR